MLESVRKYRENLTRLMDPGTQALLGGSGEAIMSALDVRRVAIAPCNYLSGITVVLW